MQLSYKAIELLSYWAEGQDVHGAGAARWTAGLTVANLLHKQPSVQITEVKIPGFGFKKSRRATEIKSYGDAELLSVAELKSYWKTELLSF